MRAVPAAGTTAAAPGSTTAGPAIGLDDWSAAVDSAIRRNPPDEDVLDHLIFVARMLSRKLDSAIAQEVGLVLEQQEPKWLKLRELQYLLHPERPLMLREQAAGSDPRSVAEWARSGAESSAILLMSVRGGHLQAWLRQRRYTSAADICECLRGQIKSSGQEAEMLTRLIELLDEAGR